MLHAALLLLGSFFGGLNYADPALLVTKASQGKINLSENGLLVHVCQGGFGGGVQVDIQRTTDKERIRLAMDPVLQTGDLVMQQLPPGRYVPTHLVLAGRDPQRFTSDTFEIRTGAITSFGKVRVAPVTNFLGLMTRLDIVTDSADILPRLKALRKRKIDSMPLLVRPIYWQVEPPKGDTSKRLSP
ncbi:MAG TPA: hypothetical protein PKO15_00080 [Fibrobacteria bacterium]|nr:hypothetical protein [Fibrobacteria bacterium]HOX50354.1 hypothetical protein [Fibrobacteria bacterium]